MEAAWQDEYYESARGHVPVGEFIEAQSSEEDWLEIFGAIEMLNDRDGSLGAPYTEKVDGIEKLWSLKVKVRSTNSIYILYSPLKPVKIHLLFHAFWNKGSRIPRQEIETAMKLMSEPRAQTRLA